jgi:phosphotransferase system enzyme I (PtsI)
MEFNGIDASPGISISKVYKLEKNEITTDDSRINDIDNEIVKFKEALKLSQSETEEIRDNVLKYAHENEGHIFNAHIEMINDPVLIEQTVELIKNDLLNCSKAYESVVNKYIEIFESMDDEYMRERASDLKDIKTRVIMNILGIKAVDMSKLDEEVIIIAHDLAPSDTARLNRKYVRGIITETGGKTSHSAIIARTFEIAAVVGMGNIMDQCRDGETVIIDGKSGLVIIDPDEKEINEYMEKKKLNEKNRELLFEHKDSKTVTEDGYEMELYGNIGSLEDLEGVLNNGGEGIGLFRTEFLYMGRKEWPTEDEQFKVYKEVLEKMEDKPVVIRTLDIGGDKEIEYIDSISETNPFLGRRAIRFCLDEKEVFFTQLRALLRASTYGNLKIMFPMISTLGELRKAKEMLKISREELVGEGVKISDKIEIGMMIEIPSAVLLADKFANEVDFFSIGTNDLIQYTFAADRMNEKVSYLYQPFNPSLLRMIKMVTEAAVKEGIWTGMCGEMAGNEYAIPLLVGLGLVELSMSSSNILNSRKLIGKLNSQDMKKHVEKVLDMDENNVVLDYVKNVIFEEINYK